MIMAICKVLEKELDDMKRKQSTSEEDDEASRKRKKG
jgi:hypothetical protein